MKKQLTVILGAGFSANADIPIANDINKMFNRDLKNKILRISSDEWFWIDDKSKNFVHNGQLGFDHIGYSYVLNELVQEYSNHNKEFINYEDFYQYIIDNFQNLTWVDNLFSKAKETLLIERPELMDNNSYLFIFENKQYSKILDILNYLIADLLSEFKKNDEEIKKIYYNFIQYITKFNEVDIFTLNHDLLLERILELNEIEFSKGFNILNSNIFYEKNPLPVFDNNFNKKIRIYKLHGSIDFYEYKHYLSENGTFYKFTGETDFFISKNYYEIHGSLRQNENNEIIQNYNFDVVPKFITGNNKTSLIENSKLFRNFYETFTNVIENSSNLLVSGYSFRDNHINNIIKNKYFNFLNHNRSEKYPFLGKGKNIITFDELL